VLVVDETLLAVTAETLHLAKERRAVALADAGREAGLLVVQGDVGDFLRQTRQRLVATARPERLDRALGLGIAGDQAKPVERLPQHVQRHRQRGLEAVQAAALAVHRRGELADRRIRSET